MNELHAAVIGVGYLGRYHAEKYAAAPGVVLAGVADINLARAREIAERLGCRAVADFRELLPAADLASVVVPTDAHLAVARECLAAGVHVLLEKPMTRTLEESDELIALAEARGARLAVSHVERCNPAFSALGAEVPRPLFVEAERLASFKTRGASVDVILDLMIHDIDLALALTGAEVASVSACGFRVLTDSVDIANARIEFTDGRVADLSASRVSQAAVRKLRAFGAECYCSADLGGRRVRVVRRTAAGQILEESRQFQGPDALLTVVESFVDSVRGGRAPVATAQDGRRALELALNIRKMIDERASRVAAAGAQAHA